MPPSSTPSRLLSGRLLSGRLLSPRRVVAAVLVLAALAVAAALLLPAAPARAQAAPARAAGTSVALTAYTTGGHAARHHVTRHHRSPVARAHAIARVLVKRHHWGHRQYRCLAALWYRESGWQVRAANPSGAYGIPQALPGSQMASAGPHWRTSASTQIRWGLGYIHARYGTPCGAWWHSNAYGWY